MYQLDRFVAVVKPRQPLLDWLARIPDFESAALSLEGLRSDCTALLIPEFDDDDEAVAFVYRLWDELFAAELEAWTDDRALWPQGRSAAMFMEWFDIEVHTTVVDLGEEETGAA